MLKLRESSGIDRCKSTSQLRSESKLELFKTVIASMELGLMESRLLNSKEAESLSDVNTCLNLPFFLKPEDDILGKVVLALHPTPAVCGRPLEIAKQFILNNEDYNRDFYTGFLGELNFEKAQSRNRNRRNIENNAYASIKKTTSLYVNLRCMQLKRNEIDIYVGGGITEDSNAESEWQETVEKTSTIKKVL